MSKPKSSQHGGSNGADGKQPLATQSSSVATTPKQAVPTILDTSENSANQQSQIGFQPTKLLQTDETTNAVNIIMAFADKLGALVVWKDVEFEDGTSGIALVFPAEKWSVDTNGALALK